MHRAHTCYGLSQAFSCSVIFRNHALYNIPRSIHRSIGTNDDSHGKSRPPVSTPSSSDTTPDEKGDSSPSPDEPSELKAKRWTNTWPSSGSKKYSPALARQILPLIEATADDPPGQKAERPDRLKEVLKESTRSQLRSHRNHPTRRGVLARSFRKAVLGDATEKSEDAPAWSRTRKVLPRHMRSTELLEQELQLIAHGQPHPGPIGNILTTLIKDRLVKVSPHHYEALILGNCHPETGSIDAVKAILREMFREEVPIISSVAFAVVKVLSVHPDSLLRAYITDLMESQWITISPAVAQLMVVAMIREGQLELARTEIDRLHEKGLAMSDWVWTILIHALCDRGDCDAILHLFYTLPEQGRMIARPTLLHVLEHASSVKDLDLTKHIWRTYVECMHVVPDEAICMHVMVTAAHHNDLTLAESVAIVLKSVTTSTLSPLSKQSSDPDLKPTTSGGVDHGDSIHQAHTNRPGPFEDFQSTEQSDSRAFPAPVKSDSRIDAFNAAAAQYPGPSQGDKASLENDAHRSRGPLPASPSTEGEGSATATRRNPRPRTIPREAKALLASVRASHKKATQSAKEYRLGNLFPLFREDMGLGDARFDPRLALRRRQDWWLQPVSKETKEKNIRVSGRSKPPRG